MRRLLPCLLVAALVACSGGGDEPDDGAVVTTSTTLDPGADAPRTSVVDAGGSAVSADVEDVSLSLRQASSGSAILDVTATLDNPEDGLPVVVGALSARCGDADLALVSSGGEAAGVVEPGASAALALRALVHGDEAPCEDGPRLLVLHLARQGPDGPVEDAVELGDLPDVAAVLGPLAPGVLSADGLCAALDRAAVGDYLQRPVVAVEVHRLSCVGYDSLNADERHVMVDALVDTGPVTPVVGSSFGCTGELVAQVDAPEVLACPRGQSSVAVLSLPDVVVVVTSERTLGPEATVNLLAVLRPAIDQLRG